MQEAQKKLLIVLATLIVASIVGAIFYKQILSFIMNRFDLTGINVVLTSPYQVIELAIQTGIYTGLVITLPLMVYMFISFLKPALQPDEYKLIVSLIPISIGLFVTGFLFGVWVMNFVIQLFTKATFDLAVGNIWDISRFFSPNRRSTLISMSVWDQLSRLILID